jgi:ribosomal protein S18 acetylase RimI-like enzyme
VSSERIIIDIIKICDCIDAATDILGRNYAKAKSFETVLKELIEGAGESYSDEIVNLITKDNELIHEISWFTREERRHTYYEIYKDMVADKVDFVYDDELHVREYIDEDMEDIVRMRSKAENAILEDYLRCKENSYVLSDGYGILYGYIFMEAKGEILEIVDLYIDKKDRRKGNGSYMLAEVEKIVKNKGYRKLKIRNITEGHVDKFFWYSEFTNYDDNEYLQKYL